jgi:hypothetical protein
MNAYEIAHQLSKLTTNQQRKQFINKMVDKLASITGRTVVKQEIAIDERFGNTNFLLPSNDQNPLIISAHYDAFLVGGETTTPGANDNGSGIGALCEAASKLFHLPVDFVFFGGEEIGCKGAKEYLKLNTKTIRGIVNLDTCGSGGDLGLLIPKIVHVNYHELKKTDDALNQTFIKSAIEIGLPIHRDDVLATGDHGPFLEAGIPATTLQGEDLDFFGIVDGEYVPEKMIMHTPEDTIDWIDEEFLSKVVEVLIVGVESLNLGH